MLRFLYHTQFDTTPGRTNLKERSAATYTTGNKHRRRTFTPSAGFEHTIPAMKGLEIYVSHRTACKTHTHTHKHTHTHTHTHTLLCILTLILRRSRTGTVWFYTSTSNKRAARPKLYTKSLTRDLKRMYSRFTLVRISINL